VVPSLSGDRGRCNGRLASPYEPFCDEIHLLVDRDLELRTEKLLEKVCKMLPLDAKIPDLIGFAPKNRARLSFEKCDESELRFPI
jgi:hypothetical protein